MTKFGIGQPVPRTEDARLLTGGGRYTDDVSLPGQAYAAFVRSPYAHADVTGIDSAAALAAPGVLAVYTAADLDAAGIGPIECQAPVRNRDRSRCANPKRPALARGRVRHVGDPVAVVIAETVDQARDAMELVAVEYAERPSVSGTGEAMEPGRPLVWDETPDNRCFDWGMGDEAGVEAAFAAAARVVELDLINNRVVANPMEGRACLAAVEEGTGRLVLYVSSQGVHGLRKQFSSIFKLPEERFRFLTTDVGGGFGMKIFNYPEYVAALFAARELGRPVKWTSERTEGFLSDDHGRDHVTKARIALDAEGHFLAIRVDTIANMGAYLSNYGPFVPTDLMAPMLVGSYRTPVLYARVQGVFTNTQPVDAYRGAGRPEAAYLLERLVDHAAREVGIDPVEIRRRNFVPATAMPYSTPLGQVYDSGDFAKNLDDALAMGDHAGLAARKSDAARRGKLRGAGISTYIEACSGGGPEQATVEVAGDGRVVLFIGTQTNGQGHETAYKQILADRLGVPPEDIEVVQGDTDRVSFGSGTGGSRSVPVGGAALAESAGKVVAKASAVAADLLEAAPVDVEFKDGAFTVVGTDRAVSWKEVAAKAATAAPGAPAFSEMAQWTPPSNTYPNGTHFCEVEVDPDTGEVEVVSYTVVDDFGMVINPLLVQGQIHGGVAQGIGQALQERVVFDPESGQLLTGSFMDYQLPRAVDIPPIAIKLNCVPSTTNALGMKGAGEAGAIGSPPAVINALVDALSVYGIRHVDMPATPQAVWSLIQAHRTAAAAE
ncbi:xanthine dehydrogenase family protein molybdopterin-binding subunit [Azospirillum sp. RWY-5-1]|uniref:Xanthine dehydrogenase family protein molybdopterin-binding subunit n=1 Tax=Azospirillum oleiclasticum TaxID=2735135 RepID=A0ABX2T614_9PROT|nr:xanthine dehydrogenase family protein molybdopterin-binding subunit [Azospirillum oleiclasticum]NYZ12337.1 xanthine dehydrogenase family protein molybdopterin-binding subunit [Azospirillum oleiclasticum]NYZ19497.1 xanthine dehydrogenase family protein molybdopterin-binding subunit [Azospirillum oleiclasticum]